jgi:hypothetical protein
MALKRVGIVFLGILATMLAVGTLTAADAKDGRMQMQLTPGQVLKLELSTGTYRIEAGAADKLVVISQSADSTPKPRFGVDTTPKQTSLKVEGPPNYAAVIQVPRNTELHIRLDGGQLNVADFEGDKDIESHAGTIRVDVGRPENYSKVDASVGAGHIDARAFQADQEGFGRSFRTQGPGRFRLHAHVGSGDITFFSGTM